MVFGHTHILTVPKEGVKMTVMKPGILRSAHTGSLLAECYRFSELSDTRQVEVMTLHSDGTEKVQAGLWSKLRMSLRKSRKDVHSIEVRLHAGYQVRHPYDPIPTRFERSALV